MLTRIRIALAGLVSAALFACAVEPTELTVDVAVREDRTSGNQSLVSQIDRFRFIVKLCDGPNVLIEDFYVDMNRKIDPLIVDVKPGDIYSLWVQGWSEIGCSRDNCVSEDALQPQQCTCFDVDDIAPARLVADDCTSWLKSAQGVYLELDTPNYANPQCPEKPPCYVR